MPGPAIRSRLLLAILIGCASPLAQADNPLDKIKSQVEQLARQRAGGQAAGGGAGAAQQGANNWAAGVGSAQALGADFGTPDGTAAIAAASPRLDIVGIRLGMPAAEAIAAVKAYNRNMLVETSPLEYQSMPGKVLVTGFLARIGSWLPRLAGDQATGEGIMAGLVMSPSTPVVWSLHREIDYNQPNTRPASDNVAAALLEKYGAPTYRRIGTNDREFRWFIDTQGAVIQRLSDPQMNQMGACNGGYFTRRITNEAHGWMIPMNDAKSNIENGFQRSVGGFWNQYCASVGAIIEARIEDQEPGRARHVQVTISNPRLKWSGNEATRKMLVEAQNGAQAREMDAARSRGTPKF